jgi:AcrR family transcriptional regulator
MSVEGQNTEQAILTSAEDVFLEKGYVGAKTTEIARKAGINHALLHYYFRTKVNLFQMIFRRKIQELSQIFEGISAQGLPFADTVRLFIECQFDFIAKNPRLPRFVLNEILTNEDNLKLVVEVVKPKITEILFRLEKMLNDEIEKGTVRPINFMFLVMNVVSLNISSFIAMPVLDNIFPDITKEMKQRLLAERRESNVQFILNAIRK